MATEVMDDDGDDDFFVERIAEASWMSESTHQREW